MIIALDGQSGTGKSTLSKLVAKKLGFKYLNTGMIYRAITYYFVKNNILPNDINEITNALSNINIYIKFDNDNQMVYVDNQDITPYVSSQEVQRNVSLYSQIFSIREKITEIQRVFAQNNNIVVEGRDIGTHVFPNADYKFFVTCNIEIRAKRRLDDLVKSGQNITLDEVVNSLKNRDYIDTTREFSPLKRADDAIDIDTSNSTIDESVNEIIGYIRR